MSDIHALSGAYAIDALDDIERAQFARHLPRCAECQAEVESLQETAAQLAETSVLAPPAALRERVLAEIKNVRPLPPIAPDHAVPATIAKHSTPMRTDRRWLRGLVAAAAVVATLGAGGVVWQQLGDDSSQGQLSAADRVLQAPDAERVSQKLSGGGVATVVASRSLNKIVLISENLPKLAEGTVYEMWIQDAEKGMVPAGLMTAEDSTVVLDGNVANAVGAGITVEPAGGSHIPTTKPVALFEFENA